MCCKPVGDGAYRTRTLFIGFDYSDNPGFGILSEKKISCRPLGMSFYVRSLVLGKSLMIISYII